METAGRLLGGRDARLLFCESRAAHDGVGHADEVGVGKLQFANVESAEAGGMANEISDGPAHAAEESQRDSIKGRVPGLAECVPAHPPVEVEQESF